MQGKHNELNGLLDYIPSPTKDLKAPGLTNAHPTLYINIHKKRGDHDYEEEIFDIKYSNGEKEPKK